MTNPETVQGDSQVEVLRDDFRRGEFRVALFDFDGTLSLIRRNWQAVMIPMMVDVLTATGTDETAEQLETYVEEYVMRLNGKQTIYQMIQLVDEVRQRGGRPLDPLDYKQQYHDLLWEKVSQRIESVRSGERPREELTVPGTHALLTELRDRGLEIYLASGTDVNYVRDEVEVLGLSEFFGERIYGALDDYKSFSKKMIIEQIIREAGYDGHQLIGIGDGFVEIEEMRRAGGVAVGVASEEETRTGINEWKRQRLIRAGADIIIGDYRRRDQLYKVLGL